MPELELETMFDLDRDLSESSSTVNKEDRSNSQSFLQQPGASNGTTQYARQLKPTFVVDCANPKDDDPNQLTLKAGSSSVDCDIVVTVEPPQTKQVDPEACDEVVVVLEDDESLFNKDLNDYQETALWSRVNNFRVKFEWISMRHFSHCKKC